MSVERPQERGGNHHPSSQKELLGLTCSSPTHQHQTEYGQDQEEEELELEQEEAVGRRISDVLLLHRHAASNDPFIIDIPVKPITTAQRPMPIPLDPSLQNSIKSSNNHQHLRSNTHSDLRSPTHNQHENLLHPSSSSPPPHHHQLHHPLDYQQQQQLSSLLSFSLVPHTQSSTNLTAEMIEQSLTPYRVGKNWACRICGRQFTRRFNCTTHERTHLDLRERAQFQCGLCERAFTRRHDLERHVHSVHPGHTLERGTNRMMTPRFITHPSSDQNQLQNLSPPSQQLQLRTRPEHQAILSRSSSSDPLRNSDQARILVIDPSSINQINQKQNTVPIPSTSTTTMSVSEQSNLLMTRASTSVQIYNNSNDNVQPPTAILTSGSIREVSQAIERVPLDQISRFNPNQEPIFKYSWKWACGTCGRIFIRRNNCKAHEATHRDIREHQCLTCSRSFSRKHDLERHILAVHPGIDLSESGTASAGREGYESSELISSRKKRRKQQSAGTSDDWTAIDPMILNLDHQQHQMTIHKSAKNNKNKNRNLNDDQNQPWRITHRDDDDEEDDDGIENEVEEHHEDDHQPKRSGGSSQRVTQPKSRRHSNPLELCNSNTTHSFNIFETFDPNPAIQSINDSNSLRDNLPSFYPTRSDLPFPAPLHPIHPASCSPSPSPSDCNHTIKLDPRLFSS